MFQISHNFITSPPSRKGLFYKKNPFLQKLQKYFRRKKTKKQCRENREIEILPLRYADKLLFFSSSSCLRHCRSNNKPGLACCRVQWPWWPLEHGHTKGRSDAVSRIIKRGRTGYYTVGKEIAAKFVKLDVARLVSLARRRIRNEAFFGFRGHYPFFFSFFVCMRMGNCVRYRPGKKRGGSVGKEML